MPWYRRLIQNMQERGTARVAFTGLEPAETLTAYFDANRVAAPSIVSMPRGILVTLTPTMLMVDREGYVTASWIGMLNADQEDRVLELFSN
jgi:hypothetical protein